VFIIIPLILSGFTHLYNPIGFPAFHPDEGVYLRRSLHVSSGLGPQDDSSKFDHSQESNSSYDHPFFGQLLLGGIFYIIGFPSITHPSPSSASIELIYTVPRIIVGIFSILDTYLLYRICEQRYDRKVALVSAILFAVMPLTWYTRRIVLDSILLPLVLGSLFIALKVQVKGNWQTTFCLVSGILMGLAIFTKIPAFTFIPVFLFLFLSPKMKYPFFEKKNLKYLAIWILPVLFIPLIWPIYSLGVGQFDQWLDGVLWQGTERHNEGRSLIDTLNVFWISDPLLLILGTIGIGYCALRKDIVPLLWVLPYLAFLFFVGWVTHFHMILIIPPFCLAIGSLIVDLPRFIKLKYSSIISVASILVLGIFALIATSMLISTNVSTAQFKGIEYVAKNTVYQNNSLNNNDITIISSPAYSWLFKYVFNNHHTFSHDRDTQAIKTPKVILVVDSTFKHVISMEEGENSTQIQRLNHIYNNTQLRAIFKDDTSSYDREVYPYTAINSANIGSRTEEIRFNY
jgi:hypothetical protein